MGKYSQQNTNPEESSSTRRRPRKRTVAAVAALAVFAVGGVTSSIVRALPQERPATTEDTGHGAGVTHAETSANPVSPEALLATDIKCNGIELIDFSSQLSPSEAGNSQLLQVNIKKLDFYPDSLEERTKIGQGEIAGVSPAGARTLLLADNNPQGWFGRTTGEVPTEETTLNQSNGNIEPEPVLTLRPTDVAPGTSAVVALTRTVALEGQRHLVGVVPCGVISLSDGGTPTWKETPNPDFMQPLVFDMNKPEEAQLVQHRQ